MKKLERPISGKHKSAMFFNSIIAEGENSDGEKFYLEIHEDGELEFNGDLYTGEALRRLGESGAINDKDIDDEERLTVYVAKYFVVTNEDHEVLDDDYEGFFPDYDEAILFFEQYLDE